MASFKRKAVLEAAFFLTTTAFILLGSGCTPREKSNDGTSTEDTLATSRDTSDLTTLDMLIRRNPKDASLFSRRAKVYSARNNNKEALNDIAIALSLDSLNPNFYIQQAEYFLYNGQPNSAKTGLTNCIGLFPKNTDLMIKLAEIHFYLKEYPRAQVILRDVLMINDDIAQIYFLQGLMAMENHDTTMAIRYMQTAIEKDPDFYAAYIQAGRMTGDQKNDLAIQYYTSAIDLEPGSYEAHYQLGLYYQNNGYLEEAISEYDYIILNIDSTVANPFYNKGYIEMIYKAEFEQAIEYFSKALEFDPNYSDAWYNRGFCHELSGDYRRAREDFQQTLKLSPNFPLAIKGLNRLDDGKPIKIKTP